MVIHGGAVGSTHTTQGTVAWAGDTGVTTEGNKRPSSEPNGFHSIISPQYRQKRAFTVCLTCKKSEHSPNIPTVGCF